MKLSIAFLLSLIGIFSCTVGIGQKTVTLESCLQSYDMHSPYKMQSAAIEDIAKTKMDLYNTSLRPQASVIGQATYQSDVTGIPINIPGINPLSKDQYRAYLDVNQSITDLFNKDTQRQFIQVQKHVDILKNEVAIYSLKEQVIDLYFGILQSQKQLDLMSISRKQVESGMAKLKAALDNGLTNRIQLDLMKAEELKIDQNSDEINFRKASLIEMLSAITNENFTENDNYVMPELMQHTASKRPELNLLEAQKNLISMSEKMLKMKSQPRVSLFAQTGVGRPALNMLSNSFDFYYIGGVRIMWNINSMFNQSKDLKLNRLQTTSIDVQNDMFLLSQKMKDIQIEGQKSGVEAMLAKDAQIIAIKESAVENAKSKLSLGTIDALDYIQYVNQAEMARQQALIRELQSLKYKYLKMYNLGI
ncbi:MAG: hypothetical protein R2774_11855 [Saprospiraceae bacterium]